MTARAVALLALSATFVVAACISAADRATADSTAAAAAADSAQRAAIARAAPPPPRPKGPLSLSVSGNARFQGDSGFHVTCIASESNGERLMQIEALSRDARLNFTIFNAREGELPVGNKYARRAKSRVGNLNVSVGTKNFADGAGRAQITDPYGREGTLSANGFVKMGAKKRESHFAELTVRLRWSCE